MYREGMINANQVKQRHSTGIPANEICRKHAHSEDLLRGLDWRPGGILSLCLIKTDVECSKCFLQIQPFLGRGVGSCPSDPGRDIQKEMIPADQVSGFPAFHKEPWEVSCGSTQCQVRGWHTLPALSSELQPILFLPAPPLPACVCVCGGAGVLFCPLLLQPAVLACLLSRNVKVGSQGLSRMLPSAFSIPFSSVLLGSAHWLYI